MCKIGGMNNHMWRCNRALISNFSTVSPLMGLRKDHKKNISDSKILGPKLRPLCLANQALNAPLNNLMAKICRSLANEKQLRARTEVISSEELMYNISVTNRKIENRVIRSLLFRERVKRQNPRIQDLFSSVALSMDISALYLSISIDLAYETVIQTVRDSMLPWEEVDMTTLERFLVMTVTDSDIKKYKVRDCVPKPKPHTMLNSWVKPSKKAREDNGNCQLYHKIKETSEKKARVMIALAVATTVVTMKNHYHTFLGLINRQSDGIAIGSDLSDEIARNVMSEWDMKFLKSLKSLGIILDLYSRYVDDQLDFNIESNTIEYSAENLARDSDHPAVRTTKILQNIANRLMIVLNLDIWVECNIVRHGFYKKPISNNFTILKRSAISKSTKCNTTFMEAYRRIINCDELTSWSEIVKHLSIFSNTMRISGYSKHKRYHSIKGAIARYCEIKHEIKVGICESLYRNGDMIRQAKER